jgi:hypothetical protein
MNQLNTPIKQREEPQIDPELIPGTSHANSTKRTKPWIPVVVATTMIPEAHAFKQYVKNLQESIVLKITTEWTYDDIILVTASLLLFTIIMYFGYSLMMNLKMYSRTVINQTKHCKNAFCNGWADQCDIYLQVATHTCRASLKIYLGTILGPPSGLDIKGNITINNVTFKSGWAKDRISVDWGITHIEYKSMPFVLPTEIKLPFWKIPKRISARHTFGKTDTLRSCSLVIIYNNQLLLRNLQTFKEANRSMQPYKYEQSYDTEPPYEYGEIIASPSAPPYYHPKPSKRKLHEQSSLKDQSETAETETKANLMEIKCVHCNESSFVHGSDINTQV